MKLQLILFSLFLLSSCSDFELRYEIPMNYSVSPSVSFNLDDDIFNLGGGPYGSKLIRGFEITNNFKQGHTFEISVVGGGRGTVFIEPSNVWYIEKDETQYFELTLIILDSDYANHNATLKVSSKADFHENVHEWFYVEYPFNVVSYFDIVDFVRQCSTDNPILSSDLGFNKHDYWRSILRC